MTTDDVRLDPIEVWARSARDYAHLEANWIDYRLGETPERHADALRYKYRLPNWATALTFWYTVDVTPQGEVWKHLSIGCSQQDLGASDAETMRAQVNASKEHLLELFTPIVRMFFPLSTKVATHFDVKAPIPVAGPDRQVSFRVPMTFHFLVPWSEGKGPVKFEPEEVRNVATTDPRRLGWRPGAEPPDSSRWVLAWLGAEALFTVASFDTDDQTWDDGEQRVEVLWWRELPVPPVTP